MKNPMTSSGIEHNIRTQHFNKDITLPTPRSGVFIYKLTVT
jgi:hypothetical protein